MAKRASKNSNLDIFLFDIVNQLPPELIEKIYNYLDRPSKIYLKMALVPKNDNLDKSIFPIENLPPELIYKLIPYIGRLTSLGLNEDFNYLAMSRKWSSLTLDLYKISERHFYFIKHVKQLTIMSSFDDREQRVVDKILKKIQKLKLLDKIYLRFDNKKCCKSEYCIDLLSNCTSYRYDTSKYSYAYYYIYHDSYVAQTILETMNVKEIYIENLENNGDFMDAEFLSIIEDEHLFIHKFDRLIYKDLKNFFIIYDKKISLLVIGCGTAEHEHNDFHFFADRFIQFATNFKTVVIQIPKSLQMSYHITRLKNMFLILYESSDKTNTFTELEDFNFKKSKMSKKRQIINISDCNKIEDFLFYFYKKKSIKDLYY